MKRTIAGFLLGLGMLCAHAQQDQATSTNTAPLTLDQVNADVEAQHAHALKVIWIGGTTSILLIIAGCVIIYLSTRKKNKTS